MLQRLIETKIITPLRPGFKIKSKIKLTFVVKSLPLTFLIAYIENKQISLTFGDCLLWIYPDGFWLKQLSYFSLNDISISGNLNFQIWYATDFSVFVSYSWVLMSHNFWKPAYSSSTILGCHERWTACWKRSNSESRQIPHILSNYAPIVYTVGGATGYSMSFLVENNTAMNTLLCTLI